MTQYSDDIDFDFQPAPPDKIYAHNRRQLSAMLDGELSPDQARFMLRRLQHDAALAACWERWQVAGDVLRGRGHALLPADFSRRVLDAIADPAAGAAEAHAPASAAAVRGQHRLLRWGGGALAASVALVALFLARQVPDASAPELAGADGPARSAPALVEAPPVALADAGGTGGSQLPARAPDAVDAGRLLAAAVPAAVAVAEVPRRTAEQRGTTRSQAQRSVARRTQAAEPRASMVAAAATPAVAADGRLPALAGASPVAAGDALFGAQPDAVARPWPRAVLPDLSRGAQPFAAGYGLPHPEAFAPFQPRFEGEGVIPRSRFAPSLHVPEPAGVDDTAAGAEPGAGPGR